MHTPAIHTVDLSPFFASGDESGRQKARDTISEACTDFGVFEIVNHGVPLDLMDQLMELSKTFFSYSDEMKHESTAEGNKSMFAGYCKKPVNSFHNYEYVLMFSPEIPFNGVPTNPPDFRKTYEEVFKYISKTVQILEEIINESLGLPPNSLKVYNDDRSWDFMVATKYPPATENENIGIAEHEDGNLITIVLQDDVEGLEVCKDGEWISVIPSKGKLVVKLCNLIKVLSNKKFKSVTHRVVRPKGKFRHSVGFCYNLQGEKWVEPLPKFTREIGVEPKYKGFYYKDYIALKAKEEIHPPSRPEDFIRISHYEI